MTDKTIFRYRMLEWLGEGGLGLGSMGEDENLRRPVAPKFLCPDAEGDHTTRGCLLREAEAAAAPGDRAVKSWSRR